MKRMSTGYSKEIFSHEEEYKNYDDSMSYVNRRFIRVFNNEHTHFGRVPESLVKVPHFIRNQKMW